MMISISRLINIFILILFVHHINAQIIDSVSVMPPYPTPTDTIYAHLFGYKGMSNNHIRRISVSSNKDTLVVKTFGMSCGGWAVITYFDTIVKLGLLPNGNYILCVISCLDTNTADSSCSINHRFYYMDTVMANFLVLGVEEPIVKPTIELIPNPFGVAAEIILDRIYREVKIDVVDGCGRMIRSTTHNNRQSIEFRRGTLKNGIYYLRILLDDEIVQTIKIIITG